MTPLVAIIKTIKNQGVFTFANTNQGVADVKNLCLRLEDFQYSVAPALSLVKMLLQATDTGGWQNVGGQRGVPGTTLANLLPLVQWKLLPHVNLEERLNK